MIAIQRNITRREVRIFKLIPNFSKLLKVRLRDAGLNISELILLNIFSRDRFDLARIKHELLLPSFLLIYPLLAFQIVAENLLLSKYSNYIAGVIFISPPSLPQGLFVDIVIPSSLVSDLDRFVESSLNSMRTRRLGADEFLHFLFHKQLDLLVDWSFMKSILLHIQCLINSSIKRFTNLGY